MPKYNNKGNKKGNKSVMPTLQTTDQIAEILTKQIDKEIFDKKYAKTKEVLEMVGAGLFLAASLVMPNLPKNILPYFNQEEKEAWKRFNIPYLKRILKRLEERQLVEIEERNGTQIVKITKNGRVKVIKSALDKLEIEKPKYWNNRWWLVSYDVPERLRHWANVFRSYLKMWDFYPLQESVFLHAYPCKKQIEFLREYLGIGEFVRIIEVSKIENDRVLREFFGV